MKHSLIILFSFTLFIFFGCSSSRSKSLIDSNITASSNSESKSNPKNIQVCAPKNLLYQKNQIDLISDLILENENRINKIKKEEKSEEVKKDKIKVLEDINLLLKDLEKYKND